MPHFFISYRRGDQEGKYLAHMIFRELRRRYGEQSVFLDVDSRSPGLSFPVKINRALNVTDVVLVIIGPAWLQLLTERLEDSRDWVRYEVAESLKRSWLPVVPVCLTGVEMPRPHQLPEELKDLGWRDGVFLDPFQDFEAHLGRLLSDVEHVLETASREKEELRLARWKLTALLRWRAHQLELAAAREAAAKLAMERAAEERAAAAEQEAKRVAEIAQGAARAKAAGPLAAAQVAKDQKKGGPEPKKAREAPAVSRPATDGTVAVPEAAFPLIQTGMSKKHFEARLENLHGRYTDHPVSSEVLQTKISHLKAYGPEEFRSLLDGLRDGVYSQPFGWYCALVHLHHYGRLAFAALEAEEVAAAAPASSDDLVDPHIHNLLHFMEERSSGVDQVVGCSLFPALPLPFVVLSWMFDLVWWKVALYGIGLTLLLFVALGACGAFYHNRIIRQTALEFGRMFPASAENREQAVSELLKRSNENERVKRLHKAVLKML